MYHHRMVVSRDGDLGYHHTADPSWDVNEYLVELKAALKSWRDVYWRLWGTVNVVRCARCGETVPCVELGQCRWVVGLGGDLLLLMFSFESGTFANGI